MGTESELVKSVWIGSEFISIGDVKKIGEQLFFKKIGGLPLDMLGISSFVPILANADKIPYQERKLWHPSIGDTGNKVRIFMSDLRLDKYYALTNPQDLTAIAHLKTENISLKNHLEQLYNMILDVNNEDRLLKRIKKLREQYNTIMGYGGSGGSYNPYSSPFSGGGFSPTPEMGGELGEQTNF